MNETKVKPRISSGKYKGRRLEVPNNARPTTERFKIKLFDMLGERIEGARVLDLFAGSGAFGIEALSRGAAYVEFVDISTKSTAAIKANLANFEVPKDQYEVIKKNYIPQINANQNSYDIVFADPPFTKYEEIRLNRLVEAVNETGLVCIKAPFSRSNKFLRQIEDSIVLREKVGKNELIILNSK